MVRVFEDGMGPRTALLEISVKPSSMTQMLYSPFKNPLEPQDSLLIMVKQNSDTFSIGCICYVANLCAQDGIKLSVPVDDLIDIYCNSEHNEIHLRAPAFHRWLIWTYCITLDLLVIKKKLWTVFNQYAALSSYIESHSDVEKPGSHPWSVKVTKDPDDHTLPSLFLLNEFHKLFQTNESQTDGMMEEMWDRLQWIHTWYSKNKVLEM